MATVQDEFNKFLCDANLLMFKDSFISEGVERVCDVMDLSDDTLTGFGLTKTQINRLRRMFQKWQLENQPQPKEQRIVPKAGEVEGKINVHVPLNFFNSTGGDILQVSKEPLTRRYANLWYPNPNSLKQNLNNSFILAMCYERERDFHNLRALEDWSRKERERRISILMSIQPYNLDFAKESTYMKQKSVPWMWGQLKTKYPVVSTLETDMVNSISGSTAQKIMLYHDGLQQLEEMLSNALRQAEQGLSETIMNRDLRVKESFKEMHQWYKDIIVKINELQERVSKDVTRIATLKEFVAEKYQIHQGNTATAEKKRKKNKQKDQVKKMKRNESSSFISNINSSTSKQKLMTPFLKLDCVSTGNTQEIDGVVCSASINEDINDSKSVTDPHNIRHSSAVNETSEADSQLPLREQEEVISVLNPHNFGRSPSIINVKTQTDSQHSSDKQNEMFCDVSRAEDNIKMPNDEPNYCSFEEKWDIFDHSDSSSESSFISSDSLACNEDDLIEYL